MQADSVYNYFRDYDPSTGRYVQSDPIGLAGGLNTYGYVGGNPLYWSDRFGLESDAQGGGYTIPGFAPTFPLYGPDGESLYKNPITEINDLIKSAIQGANIINKALIGIMCSDRVENPPKSDSPVWNGDELKPDRDGRKNNGQKGKKKEFYEWDHTHNDIEVYDSKGKHKGSMDPRTGDMYKPPVPGRTIDL